MLSVVPRPAGLRKRSGDVHMVTGRFEQQSVFDALAWIDMTRSSGALRVTGAQSGALFFSDGRVYFGMVEGRKLGIDELNRAGISRESWTTAGARADDDGRSFAEKLVEAGATPDAVRTFVWNRIIDVVSAFAELGSGEFATAPGRHGFGSTVSFRVDDVARAVRRGMDSPAPAHGPSSIVSLQRASVDVKITAEDWNTLMSLIPPLPFADLIERSDSFSADRLVSALLAEGLVVVTSPPGAPIRRDLPPPPVPDDHSQPEDRPDYDFAGNRRRPARDTHDPDLPDTFAVGRDTYAAMAGIRTTTTGDHDTTTKTSALRRLIDAVRGL